MEENGGNREGWVGDGEVSAASNWGTLDVSTPARSVAIFFCRFKDALIPSL